jgi:hypothetical protein
MTCGEQHQPLPDYQPGDDEKFKEAMMKPDPCLADLKWKEIDSASERLLPCPTPWCDRSETPEPWQGPDDRYSIICPVCQVEGLPDQTEEGARDNWNTRTRATPPVDERMIKAGYEAAKADGLTGPRKDCENLVRLILRAALAAASLPDEKRPPNPEWEAKAEAWHAATVAEVGEANPFDTLAMLERWKADAEPANEHGQVSFSRALLDSATDALRVALRIARNEHERVRVAREALERIASSEHEVGCSFDFCPRNECPTCPSAETIARQALASLDEGEGR